MTCKPWDIILVPFPFTDLSSHKKRPALVISPEKYNQGPDVIIMFITSNLSVPGREGDYKIEKWQDAGLPKPSLSRMKLATVEKNIILKKIGRLHPSDIQQVRKNIGAFFGVS